MSMAYRGDVLYVVLRCKSVILDWSWSCWQKPRLGTVRPLPASLRLVSASKRLERQRDQHPVDCPAEPDPGAAAVVRRAGARPAAGEHGRGGHGVAGGHGGGDRGRRRRRAVPAEEAVRRRLEIHDGGADERFCRTTRMNRCS